jgi:hypothetical protein
MKTIRALPLLLTGLLLAGCSTTPATPKNSVTAADITVEFQNPEKFRDVLDSLGGRTDESALETLRAYLKKTSPAYLQDGQKLLVTFTDIDLAGEYQLTSAGQYDRTRLIKSMYSPRMEFTFAVTDSAGSVVKQGVRTLSDLNFQAEATRIGSNVSYYYDMQLLEGWLRDEFK